MSENQTQSNETDNTTSYGETTYDARHDHKSDDEGAQTAPISGVVDAIKNAISGSDEEDKKSQE